MQGDQKESAIYLRDRMMAMELLKSGQILDIEPTGFPDGVDMSMQNRERSRFLKDIIAINGKGRLDVKEAGGGRSEELFPVF